MQNSGFDKFIVGERLKILREREDITQGQLAQLLKITQQTYSRYETAKATLPLLHLYRLYSGNHFAPEYTAAAFRAIYPAHYGGRFCLSYFGLLEKVEAAPHRLCELSFLSGAD